MLNSVFNKYYLITLTIEYELKTLIFNKYYLFITNLLYLNFKYLYILMKRYSIYLHYWKVNYTIKLWAIGLQLCIIILNTQCLITL